MAHDWFRNTTWNAEVEGAFDAKLRRARDKSQYLRIQASTLAETHPSVALDLLARYFELPPTFDRAHAFCDRATAFLALGRVDEALSAYEDALAREASVPNVVTQAYLAFPYLVAMNELRGRFDQALRVLEAHQTRPVLPLERFRWHAARALLATAMGDDSVARMHAARALDSATSQHSGLAHHHATGLVSEREADAVVRLRVLLER